MKLTGPTPESDAKHYENEQGYLAVDYGFAQQLERERDLAVAALEGVRNCPCTYHWVKVDEALAAIKASKEEA